ncbi:hypothetical protein Tco_0533226 [Tanacetum coccineum]
MTTKLLTLRTLPHHNKDGKEKKEEGREETAKGSRKKMLGRKRAGKEQQKESSKKQKVEEEQESEEVDKENEVKLKKLLVIKKNEDIAIDAIPLATKLPVIIDDGCNGIDREDLEALSRIVRQSTVCFKAMNMKFERVLYGDLKVLFEPDIKSDIWRMLQGYRVTIWKLIDSSGVHFVRRNLKIQKMNIKFRGGLLGLKRLHGFLEVTATQVHNGNYAKWETNNVNMQSRMDGRTCNIKQKYVMNQTPRKLKRGQDIKIPQSSGPPEKVGDEAVHKELGDIMERGATTVSSLEAELDSDSGPRCQDTRLGGVDAQTSTNENGEMEITATIDGRVKTVTEASIRRNLKLKDFDGISTLPNTKIFEQLALMG